MDYKDLCTKIFALDQNIRFVGVLSSDSKLIAGGMRDGIEPLEDEIHERRWFNQIAIRREMTTMFDRILGKVHYVFADRERIKQLTFYVDNEIVFVSLEPKLGASEAVDIASSILDLIGSK